MLGQYVRGGTQSISLLARAHDMRYQAVVNFCLFLSCLIMEFYDSYSVSETQIGIVSVNQNGLVVHSVCISLFFVYSLFIIVDKI